MSTDEFRAGVRAALRSPRDGPLATRFPAPLVTAIVAGAAPEELDRLEIALEEVVSALAAVGVPRGRQFVLLGTLRPEPAREVAARLRERLGIPVLTHDPAGPSFEAGRTTAAPSPEGEPAPRTATRSAATPSEASPEGEPAPRTATRSAATPSEASPEGEPLQFDDELREAEAVVVVGPARAGEHGRRGGAGLLCPGVASARTRRAWEAALRLGPAAAHAFSLQAERALPADLVLLWDADGTVIAGEGRSRLAALAPGGGA